MERTEEASSDGEHGKVEQSTIEIPDTTVRSTRFRRHLEEKISQFKKVSPTRTIQEPDEKVRVPDAHISERYVYAYRETRPQTLPEISIEPESYEMDQLKNFHIRKEELKREGPVRGFEKIRNEVRKSITRISELKDQLKGNTRGSTAPEANTQQVPEQKPANQGKKKDNQLSSPLHLAEDSPKRKESFHWIRWKSSIGVAETYKTSDSKMYMGLTLRDFFLYVIFLICITIVALGSLNYIMYVYSFVLSDVLTRREFVAENEKSKATFRTIRTIEQLWAFITGVLLDVLYLQTTREKDSGMVLAANEEAMYVFQNVIIGVPRIRQVRVRPDSCKIPSDFETVFTTCYDYYSADAEEQKPFGKKQGSAWTYSKDIADEYDGLVSKYGRGGYYLNFTRNYAATKRALTLMMESNWIDYGTRAVFIDFTVYSPNVNLFCVVKLVAELPPSGGVVTRNYLKTLKLIRYVTIFDYFILSLEIVCIVFITWYTIEEVRTAFLLKWLYLARFWNVISLIIVLLGWNTISLAIWRYLMVYETLEDLINTIQTQDHGNFDSLTYVQELHDIFLAVLVALVWFKLLKFLMLSKVVYHILATFSKVAYELLGLLFILSIILLSFALLGHLLVGSQVDEFSTIGSSIVSLFILIIGALEYKQIQEIRPVLGSLFFMMFIFFFILIFLSLVIAVIVNGFTTLRFEIMEDRNKIYLKEISFKFFINFLRIIRMKDLANRLEAKDVENKLNQDYEIILEILRRSGFRGQELMAFLKKHKIEQGKPISEEKMQQVYNDIDTKGQLYLEAVEHEQIMGQVDILKVRMNYVDRMTEEMAAKVDLLLDKVIRR